MKNEKTILLRDVNQYIMCEICKGYLIDATTITECLHTFCKKCIVQYLEENTNCPKCDILLHQSHPLLYVAHDRTLQSIVYKLVANLEPDELERQVKYYDEHELDYPPQLKEKLEQFNIVGKQSNGCGGTGGKSKHTHHSNGTTNNNNNHDNNNSTDNKKSNSHAKSASSNNNSSLTSTSANHRNAIERRVNEDMHRLDEPISISLEPLEGLQNLDKKYILCSCHATITHLKKMVAANIYGDLELYKELDIVCDDEILGKDHTLKFIRVTKWKDKELPMRLNFRPKLVF